MSVKLYVGNLSPDTTGDELCDLLSEVGGVEWCHLITERDTGLSRGYAFVKMNSMERANEAKERFNGQDLHGRELRIEEARPRLRLEETKPRNERPIEGGDGGTRMF